MSVLVFKLYYEGSGGDYVQARIYRNLDAMRAGYRAQDRRDRRGRSTLNESTLRRVNALASHRFYRWRDRSGDRRSRHRGQMFFSIRSAGSGTVTHECVHAAAQWIELDKRGDIRLGHGSHERLASVAGHLVKQYWRCWYRAQKDGLVRAVKR